MKPKEILNTTHHRPWDIPKGHWKFYQEWNKAIFLHWQVDIKGLEKFVPNELEIDTYSGSPWISLVAFKMQNIRPRLLPSFPPISNFDEINIRTYVKAKNKTGVYFLSIEGSKRLSCTVAKSLSALPYSYSSMQSSGTRFIANNIQYDDEFDLTFKIGNSLENKSDLDLWLTERYALFQDTPHSINEFEIHHLEWKINELDLLTSKIEYSRFSNLLKGPPLLTHYSPGVKVLAWGKKKYTKEEFL